jgi:hypothetical protein
MHDAHICAGTAVPDAHICAGTAQVLTDLLCESDAFLAGFAHKGTRSPDEGYGFPR